jgi:pimeloyl-ACP methyl ester carboxylesterase
VSERRLPDDDSVRTVPRTSRRRRWRRSPVLWLAVAGYLVLVGASSAVRARHPAPPLDPGVSAIRLTPPAVDTPQPDDPDVVPVTITFDRRCPADGAPRGTPVVLLHGSPGGRFDFDDLLEPLGTDRCAIAPDLPGFGDATRAVPDYSVRAHAVYTDAFLTALHEPRVHVVGFSMGGGVAIELAARHPERVASLTLLSGLGVQEQELFGRHWVNHAVHGVQLAALWLLVEATPHFGAFDRMFLGVEYARNFYDTDQRPLRPALLGYQGPALIYHGRHDFLVPYAAALEHHRLLPQSVLVGTDGDHFDTFMRPQDVAAALIPFLAAVDRGERPTRAAASLERRAGAARPYAGPIGTAHMGPRLAIEAVAGLLAVALAALIAWRQRRRRLRTRLQ